jgi:hypothetical protein
MARFVGTKVEFGADTDEFALNIDARALPLIHSDPYLNDLLLKYCQAALADRRGDARQLRTRVENAISSVLPHGRVLVEDVKDYFSRLTAGAWTTGTPGASAGRGRGSGTTSACCR